MKNLPNQEKSFLKLKFEILRIIIYIYLGLITMKLNQIMGKKPKKIENEGKWRNN